MCVYMCAKCMRIDKIYDSVNCKLLLVIQRNWWQWHAKAIAQQPLLISTLIQQQ